MTSTHFGLTTLVYKHLRKPVLIAGVLIGSAIAFSGAAKANLYTLSCNFTSDADCVGVPPGLPSSLSPWTFTGPTGSTAPTSLTLGDKLLNIVSHSFTDFSGVPPSPIAPGHFDFTWLDANNDGIPNYRDDVWNVRTVFDNPVTGDSILGNATGTLNYTLQITDPGWTFSNVELDSGHIGSGVTVTKAIAGLTPSPYLTSTDGSASNKPLGGTLVNVTDTYSVTASGGLGAFNNGFTQTPAPLPILGVGAAFGSIRKLRKFSSRLKTFSMG